MMAFLRRFFRLIFILLLLGALGGGLYLWWYASYLAKPVLTPINPSYSNGPLMSPHLTGMSTQSFEFTSWDGGQTLATVITQSGEESSRQLSVLSALSKEQYAQLAQVDYVLVAVEWDAGIHSTLKLVELLTAVGLKCVVWNPRGVDQRHAYCTHGLLECKDVRFLLDALAKREGKENLVCAAVGQGYGASMLLHAAPLNPRIRAVVSIDAYASLRESIKRSMPNSLTTWAMLWLVDRRLSTNVGYECFDVAAVESASFIDENTPLLVMNLLLGSTVSNAQDALNIYRQSPSRFKAIWAQRLLTEKAEQSTRTEKGDILPNGDYSSIDIILKDNENKALIDMIAWLNKAIEFALQRDTSPIPLQPSLLKVRPNSLHVQ